MDHIQNHYFFNIIGAILSISVIFLQRVGGQTPPTLAARLVDGTSNIGMLEVQFNGTWGRVCDDGFNNNSAAVACRMLGFSSSRSVVLSGTFQSTAYTSPPIILDDLNCTGNEPTLALCQHSPFFQHNCGHSEDVALFCDMSSTDTLENVEVRLAGGQGPRAGRLEIRYAGIWGTVCGDSFGVREAGIVCRMLGYTTNASFWTYTGSNTSGPIWLDNVSCRGMETNIAGCGHNPIGQNDCHHDKDVAVICLGGAPSIDIRLVGGSDAMSGRVEVNINGVWGTVCDDDFTNIDAMVVCRQLGLPYIGATAIGSSYFGAGSGPILLDDVNCQGTESNISRCLYSSTHNCQHTEDVGVRCSTVANTTSHVRLEGGIGGSEGLLEIMHNGVWGTVCDDSFDNRAAMVVCRMLQQGFDGAVVISSNQFSTISSSLLRIWLDDVNCAGTESSIDYCSHRTWGENNCDHSEDVAIRCAVNNVITQVRLVGGIGEYEGKLEIMHNGEWGTVCDDSFDNMTAKVVCRMLHLPTDGAMVANASQFSISSSLRIWLDDVHCSGTESSISYCSHRAWGENDCSHIEDVAVRCAGQATYAPVRLVGGAVPYEGRVEVYHNGQWGTVCDDLADMNFAMVVCRMIGYPSTSPTIKASGYFGVGNGQIWLDDVQCRGTEAAIDECSHLPWGQNNCGHGEDVAVVCRDHGIECYACDGVSDPSNCRETIFCKSSQSCHTSKYENNQQILYSQSCESKLVCDALNSVPNIVGRKRATGLRTTCCDTPLCNNVTIGGH